MKQVEYTISEGQTFKADKLLPCPFCGGVPVLEFFKQDLRSGATISCPDCFMKRSGVSLRQSCDWVARILIMFWNNRYKSKSRYQSVTSKRVKEFHENGSIHLLTTHPQKLRRWKHLKNY